MGRPCFRSRRRRRRRRYFRQGHLSRRPGSATVKNKVDIAGSLRGKLGFAVDRFLVYGTGGVAFGDVHTTVQSPPGTTLSTPSEWRVGWTAGGGMQYAVAGIGNSASNIAIPISATTASSTSPTVSRYNSAVKFNFAQVALTYRFAPPPAPPPMVEHRRRCRSSRRQRRRPRRRGPFLVFFDFDKSP